MFVSNACRAPVCRFGLCRFPLRSRAFGTVLLLVVAGCAPRLGDGSVRNVYLCTDGAALSVLRQSGVATVDYQGSVYRLSEKRSSLGERYTSADATLIIDRHYAVFVTEEAGYPHRCYLGGPSNTGD